MTDGHGDRWVPGQGSGYGQSPPPGGYGPGTPLQGYGQAPPPGGYGYAPATYGHAGAAAGDGQAPSGRTPAPGGDDRPTSPPGFGQGYPGAAPGPPRSRSLTWVALILAALAAVAVGLVAVGVAIFSSDAEPEPPPPAPATEPEDATDDPGAGDGADQAPIDGAPADDDGPDVPADEDAPDGDTADGDADADDSDERPGPDLPQVTAADSLSPEGAELLGTVVDIGAGDLRYNEGELFGDTYYRCLFNVDFENLTDVPQEVEMEFRVQNLPEKNWTGDPRTLEPGPSGGIILGWEATSPEELGITEAECAGVVELVTLSADPG